MFSNRMRRFSILLLALVPAVLIGIGFAGNPAGAQDEEPAFTTDFRLEECWFSTRGMNAYFSLKPEYQLILEGTEENDEGELEEIRVVITVLEEKEKIDLEDEGIGKVRTRVVEEREWVDGELAEVSRNFFARCAQTDAVYYFGEDVDDYEDGEIVGHEGAWRAGEEGALPGLIMPGTFLLGSRYFQETAPGVAMDRGEHSDMGLDVETPAGTFSDCVEVVETTPLDPDEESIKRYCPGVGLVYDDGVELVDFGFDIVDFDDDGDHDDDDGDGDDDDGDDDD